MRVASGVLVVLALEAWAASCDEVRPPLPRRSPPSRSLRSIHVQAEVDVKGDRDADAILGLKQDDLDAAVADDLSRTPGIEEVETGPIAVHPEGQATRAPTAQPTAQPTALPTAQPTAQPTALPTAQPTAQPTALPTAQPTARPKTAAPTPAPTSEPTEAPTPAPTTTMTPATTTTRAATTTAPTPTAAPTPAPTEAKATAAPTAEPTSAPTARPTAAPTAGPTAPPAAADEVHVQFTLQNVDYQAVRADAPTADAVVQTVKSAVSQEAGGAFTGDDVDVELSQGSLHVHAVLRSHDGSDVAAAHAALAASGALGGSALRSIAAIPGVASASTGEVTVTGVKVERRPAGSGPRGERAGGLPLGLCAAAGAAALLAAAAAALRAAASSRGDGEGREVKRGLGEKAAPLAERRPEADVERPDEGDDSSQSTPLMDEAPARADALDALDALGDAAEGAAQGAAHPHAIVVPGGGLGKDGQPSEWTRARLRRAKELYDAAAADSSRPAGMRGPLVITLSAGAAGKDRSRVGPRKTDEPTEAEVNGLYLVRELGLPSADLLQETMSEDTLGNAFYLRTTHTDGGAMRNLVITTNRFHMPRTKAIFEKVFSLPPFPLGLDDGYRLSFEEAPDDGIDREQLFKRCEKEAGSLEQFKKLCSRWNRMQDLHSFIYKSSAKRPPSRPPAQPSIQEGAPQTSPARSPQMSARSVGSYYRGKSSARSTNTTLSYVSGQAPDTYRSAQGDGVL